MFDVQDFKSNTLHWDSENHTKGSWGQNLTIRHKKENPYLKSPSSNHGADSSVGLILVTKNKQDAILGKISIKISKRLIIKKQGIVVLIWWNMYS